MDHLPVADSPHYDSNYFSRPLHHSSMYNVSMKYNLLIILLDINTPPSIYFWIYFSAYSVTSGCNRTDPIAIINQSVLRKKLM